MKILWKINLDNNLKEILNFLKLDIYNPNYDSLLFKLQLWLEESQMTSFLLNLILIILK